MSFWSRLTGRDTAGITPNESGPASYNPGDPDGIDLSAFANLPEARSLPAVTPSPWSGYPADWGTQFQAQVGVNRLIDLAWACLDLNTRVLSTMPVYRLRNGVIIEPTQWMHNPDPTIYSSWQEFAKQLFWDYQALGEAFVYPMAHGSDGWPIRFRVIPPWLVNVELGVGGRRYKLGSMDVTEDILHIRYKSTTDDAHGHGPLEVAGARMTQIGILQKYATNLAETGGVPLYWLGVERRISPAEGRDLLDSWIESRTKYKGQPAVVGSGATLNQAKTMNAKDMALLEIAQFSESRIAILLGVPPFLVGLAGASGSLTYSNISDLFDFHDRSMLRPEARTVMDALGQWALPRGQDVELNRDDYTRLPLDKRAPAYKTMWEIGAITNEEIREAERFTGGSWTQAMTGAQTAPGSDDRGPVPVPPLLQMKKQSSGSSGSSGSSSSSGDDTRSSTQRTAKFGNSAIR